MQFLTLIDLKNNNKIRFVKLTFSLCGFWNLAPDIQCWEILSREWVLKRLIGGEGRATWIEFDAELFSHSLSIIVLIIKISVFILKRQSILSIWDSALHEKLTWTLEPKADDFLKLTVVNMELFPRELVKYVSTLAWYKKGHCSWMKKESKSTLYIS